MNEYYICCDSNQDLNIEYLALLFKELTIDSNEVNFFDDD